MNVHNDLEFQFQSVLFLGDYQKRCSVYHLMESSVWAEFSLGKVANMSLEIYPKYFARKAFYGVTFSGVGGGYGDPIWPKDYESLGLNVFKINSSIFRYGGVCVYIDIRDAMVTISKHISILLVVLLQR